MLLELLQELSLELLFFGLCVCGDRSALCLCFFFFSGG